MIVHVIKSRDMYKKFLAGTKKQILLVIEYKVDIQKLTVYLYTRPKKMKNGFKKNIIYYA